MNGVKLGVSAAASWAWGTSLIVGVEIAQTKGLAAWGIWATANAATLAVFGALTRSGLLARHVFDAKGIKAAALLIQVFCLVIQLSIISRVAVGMGASPLAGYLAASSVGVLFTVWMYRHGLITSVLTDQYQWLVTMAALVLIVAVAYWTGAPRTVYPASAPGDILWGVWSACILLSGPIGDVQHWQRAEAAGAGRAYSAGALFFALYMLMILFISSFQFNGVMNALLLIAVICVTSSTIDSIAVALHEVANKRVGTILGLSVCVFWGGLAGVGVIDLWSRAGVYRVAFALLILALAIYRRGDNEARKDSRQKSRSVGAERAKTRRTADRGVREKS